MTDQGQLLTLLQVSDTTFPTGAFGFSGGLERLTGDGWITGSQDLQTVLSDDILPRWFEFDRFYVRKAHAAGLCRDQIAELDRCCDEQMYVPAFREASMAIGRGLLASHARRGTPSAADLMVELRAGRVLGHASIVQGGVGAALGLDVQSTEAGALHGVLMSHVSAAVRLGTLGAIEALPVLQEVAAVAADRFTTPPPELPHSFAPFLDVAASRKAPNGAQLFAS